MCHKRHKKTHVSFAVGMFLFPEPCRAYMLRCNGDICKPIDVVTWVVVWPTGREQHLHDHA